MGVSMLPADERTFAAEIDAVVYVRLTGDIVPAFASWQDEHVTAVSVFKDCLYSFEAAYASKDGDTVRGWIDRYTRGEA